MRRIESSGTGLFGSERRSENEIEINKMPGNPVPAKQFLCLLL